jgi:hypothetical protein
MSGFIRGQKLVLSETSCFFEILVTMEEVLIDTGILLLLLLLLFWWWGPISTAAMKAYCTLTPQWSSVIHLPEALHTKRRERPLLAKDETKAKEFS